MSLFKVGDIVTPNFIEGTETHDYAFCFVYDMRHFHGIPSKIINVKKWDKKERYQPDKTIGYNYLFDGYDYTIEGSIYHFSSCMFLECQNEF